MNIDPELCEFVERFKHLHLSVGDRDLPLKDFPSAGNALDIDPSLNSSPSRPEPWFGGRLPSPSAGSTCDLCSHCVRYGPARAGSTHFTTGLIA